MANILKFYSLLLTSLFCFNSFGQDVDYNKIIFPDDAEEIPIEEKLVRIAWSNHPANEIRERNVQIAQLQVKSARWSWLDNISAVGNLNEFNIDESRDINNRSQFFPRYNISVRVSLGMFVDIPLQTQINKQRLYNEESNLKAQKLEVRREVLRLFNDYQLAQELYNIQSEILEDAQTAFLFYEEKFKNNEMSFEAYNDQKITYNRSRLTYYNARRDLEGKQILLEEYLGIPLEEAF